VEESAVDRFQYLMLMAACVLVTLPLEFAFDARVWRRPRRLAIALAPAFGVFVVWDMWATASGTWGFDPDYTVGVTLPGGLVVEELVFFTVVPVCALLTLEAVRNLLAGRVALPARVTSLRRRGRPR
jgi:lycopene cyclase domain-containing protein